MLISYPFLRKDDFHTDEDVYLSNVIESSVITNEGYFPISPLPTAEGTVHRWHGGVHLYGGGEPIRAIADGTVVAYRFTTGSEQYEGLGPYDTSFVLLRHETHSGENTTVVFYSLYMHLANQTDLPADRLTKLPSWLRANPGTDIKKPTDQKVWRKDVIGFAGKLYGLETCHFEIFMLDADFGSIWRDSTAITKGTGSDDWFGDAHFIIPKESSFVATHPKATPSGLLITEASKPKNNVYFSTPIGTAGKTNEELYVSVSLYQGRRIATTYRKSADGNYEQVGHPVLQENYEYELYRLSMALYPDCPSAGMEWLRFGRILGSDRTSHTENWQLIRYSDTAIGYIDLAPTTIAKLSDADFPHWQGWRKCDEGIAASAADGLCEVDEIIDLIKAPSEFNNARLRHLVCKAPTEWDDSDVGFRYAFLRAPGEPLELDENWDRFAEHVGKLSFWAIAKLGGRSVWHFHPLQFIRHFRGCGWISENEMAQCFPRQLKHLSGTEFKVQNFSWNEAIAKSRTWAVHFNKMNRKYGLGARQRLTHFFAQIIPETGYLQLMKEGDNKDGTYLKGKAYYPYYGRGLIQLTWDENYKNYGDFRNFAKTEPAFSKFFAAGWDPDKLLVTSNSNYNASNCADSAGFYVSKTPGMVKNMDSGLSVNDCVSVSRCVNGYVKIQNINGLDARLQSALFIRDVLLDYPAEPSSEDLQFTWRRSSKTEPTGEIKKNGEPVMAFIEKKWEISVSLTKQRPQ
jgi:predicted chitinase